MKKDFGHKVMTKEVQDLCSKKEREKTVMSLFHL
jgi:hypothetical protein